MRSAVATILANPRSLRALAAVVMIVALTFMFALHQRELEQSKDRAIFAVSATSWKVSELILETHRFSESLLLNHVGRADRDRLQVRFDVLWSRVDVVEQTDVTRDQRLAEVVERYRQFVEQADPIVFGDDPIPPEWALDAELRANGLANDMRVAWVRAFAGRQFADVSLEIVEREEGFRRQTLIALLVGLIVCYLVAEVFLAAAAQRRHARLEAEATAAALASAAKSRFLANVSHEVRTPLNGILGMATELQSTKLDADQRACLRVISQAGDVLLHTLNDVLDLSKVESGQLELENLVFDLHELSDAAVALYRARAGEKNLKMGFERSDDVPQLMTGDGRRISQVLHNLIGNAVKFTDVGHVTVNVSAAPLPGFIRFSVTDTGTGIDPAAQAKIFEPFSQADGSITRKKGGTGLGLSISRSLCDAMGGYLQVKSRVNEGAMFWFDLPLQEADLPEAGEVQSQIEETDVVVGPVVAPPQSILIVDDNKTNRMVLRRFLKDMDLDVEEASNGKSAVDAAHRKAFDLILMDVQMPVMDGLEATDIIRQFEAKTGRSPTRIVAVTANVMTHQVAHYMANGMDDVLGKPVSKPLLLEVLSPGARSAA